MRFMLVCLFIGLTCSCHQVIDGSSATLTKRDRVLRIMRDDCMRQMTEADWLPAEQLEALRKIKDDYHAEVPRHDSWPNLVIPESTWEIRGPLTMSEVREEYIEYRAMYFKAPSQREEFRERFEETPQGEGWARFEDEYRDGDEVYYYKSDKDAFKELRGTSGYVLIRGRSMVGKCVLFQS